MITGRRSWYVDGTLAWVRNTILLENIIDEYNYSAVYSVIDLCTNYLMDKDVGFDRPGSKAEPSSFLDI